MRFWELGLIRAKIARDNCQRCGAVARSNGSKPCRQIVIPGRTRCYYHGGSNHGAIGHKNGLKTGLHTAEAKAARRQAAAARKLAKQQVRAAVRKADRLIARRSR